MNPTALERLLLAIEKSNLLTDWERGFIESLQEQYNKRGSLSTRHSHPLGLGRWNSIDNNWRKMTDPALPEIISRMQPWICSQTLAGLFPERKYRILGKAWSPPWNQ